MRLYNNIHSAFLHGSNYLELSSLGKACMCSLVCHSSHNSLCSSQWFQPASFSYLPYLVPVGIWVCDPCYSARCNEGLGEAQRAPLFKGMGEVAPAKETEKLPDRRTARRIIVKRESRPAEPSAADLVWHDKDISFGLVTWGSLVTLLRATALRGCWLEGRLWGIE